MQITTKKLERFNSLLCTEASSNEEVLGFWSKHDCIMVDEEGAWLVVSAINIAESKTIFEEWSYTNRDIFGSSVQHRTPSVQAEPYKGILLIPRHSMAAAHITPWLHRVTEASPPQDYGLHKKGSERKRIRKEEEENAGCLPLRVTQNPFLLNTLWSHLSVRLGVEWTVWPSLWTDGNWKWSGVESLPESVRRGSFTLSKCANYFTHVLGKTEASFENFSKGVVK